MPIPLLIASNNQHKIEEFRRLLDPSTFQLLAPADLGLQLDVPETGETFAENATLKARAFCAASGHIALADDSGLAVDALGGEPGVHSARYGGPGLSDEDRTALVLERMRRVPDDQRGARFVAAIAIALPNGRTEVVRGDVEGVITRTPYGTGGFGYDPIFLYPPSGRTFAEHTPDEKDAESHRGRAARQAADRLMELVNDDILGQVNET